MRICLELKNQMKTPDVLVLMFQKGSVWVWPGAYTIKKIQKCMIFIIF